jgi:pimeloyl-ACP methyl ester carboxylesterase
VLLWSGPAFAARTKFDRAPDFVRRMAQAGMDVWYLKRQRDDDPPGRGARILARDVRGPRRLGYRRVIVAGHSRGAWIALSLLAHPGLANAVVAFSPAAHGRQDARRARAMAVDRRRSFDKCYVSFQVWTIFVAGKGSVARSLPSGAPRAMAQAAGAMLLCSSRGELRCPPRNVPLRLSWRRPITER